MKLHHVAIAALAISTTVPALAKASNDQERVAIESFRGPQAQRLQGAIETGLMARYYVVPDFSIEDMARRRGVALRDPDGMAEVGRALQVRAFLSAHVYKVPQRKGPWKVSMIVRRGDTGEALGRFVVANRSLDQLETTLAKRTSRQIGALIDRSPMDRSPMDRSPGEPRGLNLARATVEPPVIDLAARTVDKPVAAEKPAARTLAKAEPEPEVEAKETAPAAEPAEPDEPDEDEAPAPKAAKRAALPVAAIGVETRIFNRSFKHAQNQSRLNDYDLTGAISAAMSAELHPLRSLGGAMAPLGLSGALEFGLGVGSRVAGSEERLSTDVHAYEVGASYGIVTGDLVVAPTLAYAASTFDSGSKSGAPNANYKVLQPGLDLRWHAHDRFSLRLVAAYLHVLDAGSLTTSERFPRATVKGGEGTVSVAFALLDTLELSGSAGLRRYGIATNVIPGDKLIAGGAVDQTTWLGLGLTYLPSLSTGSSRR